MLFVVGTYIKSGKLVPAWDFCVYESGAALREIAGGRQIAQHFYIMLL